MICNSEIYKKSLSIIKEIEKINFDYRGKIPPKNIEKMTTNLIVNFVIDMCEKQKGKKDNICDTGIII
jgi:hypothetical protein